MTENKLREGAESAEPLTEAQLEDARNELVVWDNELWLATIDQLKWQLTCAEYSGAHNAADVGEAFKDIAKLTADRDRYREALRDIGMRAALSELGEAEVVLAIIKDVASAALADQPEGG